MNSLTMFWHYEFMPLHVPFYTGNAWANIIVWFLTTLPIWAFAIWRIEKSHRHTINTLQQQHAVMLKMHSDANERHAKALEAVHEEVRSLRQQHATGMVEFNRKLDRSGIR